MITFYLVCFLVGLTFSIAMLLGGFGHAGGHVHVPHASHVHVPHVPHMPHAPAGDASLPQGSATVPWWNAFSIMIFLCWFGGAGYLLTKHGAFVAGLVLVLAALTGLAGGAIMFLFLNRVLMAHERELTAEETEVVGAVGRVSAPIREGGTGEIVYEQLGARISAPARAEDGAAIAKDEEVFVIRYEKGIAYVRRWQELADDLDRSQATLH